MVVVVVVQAGCIWGHRHTSSLKAMLDMVAVLLRVAPTCRPSIPAPSASMGVAAPPQLAQHAAGGGGGDDDEYEEEWEARGGGAAPEAVGRDGAAAGGAAAQAGAAQHSRRPRRGRRDGRREHEEQEEEEEDVSCGGAAAVAGGAEALHHAAMLLDIARVLLQLEHARLNAWSEAALAKPSPALLAAARGGDGAPTADARSAAVSRDPGTLSPQLAWNYGQLFEHRAVMEHLQAVLLAAAGKDRQVRGALEHLLSFSSAPATCGERVCEVLSWPCRRWRASRTPGRRSGWPWRPARGTWA